MFNIFILILIDQVAKYLILRYFPQLIVFNQGISFGLLPSDSWLIINLLVIGAMVLIMPADSGKGLIVAGAIGNIIDRVLRGKIIDFMDLNFLVQRLHLGFNLPVFNLADVFICFGLIILFLSWLKDTIIPSV